MGNPSLCKYRVGVNGGDTPVIALFGILVWMSLGANTRVAAAFDLDLTIVSEAGNPDEPCEPREPDRSNQQRRPNLLTRSADGSPDSDASNEDKDIPTIIGETCGNATTRATELFAAMKDSADDRQTVLHILAKCTRPQRQTIRHAYYKMYNTDLNEAMKDKFSSRWYPNFNLLTYALTVPLQNLLADRICNILEVGESYELLNIFATFEEVTAKPVRAELDLRGSEYSCNNWLMNHWFDALDARGTKIEWTQYQGKRSSANTVNEKAACDAARKIQEDLKTHSWPDSANLLTILETTNFRQLRRVNKCFESHTGESLQKVIGDAITWWDKFILSSRHRAADAYIAILNYAENKAKFFAEILYDSLSVLLGTDDASLVFFISWRADIDLGNIKRAYKELYGTSLYDDVKDDTSGEYRDLLLAVIGE